MTLETRKIHRMDCVAGMNQMQEKSVDLIITSPPYNLGIEYGTHEDTMDYSTYLEWVKTWISACYRVLKTGGRIAINIPMEINVPEKRFIMSDYIQVLEQLGFLRMASIVWDKTNVTSRTAWGSWLSPSMPCVNNPLESILVYAKETKRKEGYKAKKNITKEEFITNTLGVWKMNPEKASAIGHPAPFCVELPKRVMKLFSYRDDLILDPFMGSGTTAVACIENHRDYIGFELEERFIQIANRRIRIANRGMEFEQTVLF